MLLCYTVNYVQLQNLERAEVRKPGFQASIFLLMGQVFYLYNNVKNNMLSVDGVLY